MTRWGELQEPDDGFHCRVPWGMERLELNWVSRGLVAAIAVQAMRAGYLL